MPMVFLPTCRPLADNDTESNEPNRLQVQMEFISELMRVRVSHAAPICSWRSGTYDVSSLGTIYIILRTANIAGSDEAKILKLYPENGSGGSWNRFETSWPRRVRDNTMLGELWSPGNCRLDWLGGDWFPRTHMYPHFLHESVHS